MRRLCEVVEAEQRLASQSAPLPGRRPLFAAQSLALRKMEEEPAITEDKIDVLLSLLPCGSISEICSAYLTAVERTEIKARVALLQQITEDLVADSPLF